MQLRFRSQFADEWESAEISCPDASSILISNLLRLDYEVLAWDGEDWADATEVFCG